MNSLHIDGNDITIKNNNTKYRLNNQHEVFEKYHVTKRCDCFFNEDNEAITINKILSKFILDDDITSVIYQQSAWCKENQTTVLNEITKFHISSTGNRTTLNYNPFVVIRTKDSDYFIHVLPVGDFEININKISDKKYIITAGLKSERLSLVVKANKEIKLPVILIQHTSGLDMKQSTTLFQEYLNQFYINNHKEIPISYNSWFYDFDKFNVSDLKLQLQAAKKVGVETFIVDAGWYGPSNDDWFKASGDWEEKKNGAFFGHMKEFSDYVIEEGLTFGLWIEPERICENTPILKDKKHFFIKAADGNYYPDLTKKEVRDYFYETLESVIKKYQVSWLKLDFNSALENDPSHSNFYYYSLYLNQLLEQLREDFPEVVFEGCDSGGMKFDIANNKLYDVHFLSDNVNPIDGLTIYQQLLLRMTPSSVFKWTVLRDINNIPEYTKPLSQAKSNLVTPKGATWERFESIDSSFLFTSMMLSHIGLSGDLSNLSVAHTSSLKDHIDFYKENRKFFSNCIAVSNQNKGYESIMLSSDISTMKILYVFRLDATNDVYQINVNEINYKKSNQFYDIKGNIMKDLVHSGIVFDKQYTAKVVIIKN